MRQGRPGRHGRAVAVVMVGSVALLARPWLVRLPVDPVTVLVVLFVVLGVVGATWRLPPASALGDGEPVRPEVVGRPQERTVPLSRGIVLGLGLGAFGIGRLLAVGTVPVAPFLFRSVALNSLAAVSEEAFFRRLTYGLVGSRGPGPAIVVSAVVFAAVHVTIWGWAVLPLDLAAGLVLGWQRWASGGWGVPAATHVAANVLAVV